MVPRKNVSRECSLIPAMRLNFFVLLATFAAGLLYCYISTPPPEVVYKFPNPLNAGRITYRAPDDQCYRYKASKVTCPLDKTLIRPQFAPAS